MSRQIEVLREVVVKVAQLLAGKRIEVTQCGAQAFARADRTGKPVLVNIPHIPDDASEAFCQAIQGFIDHELGHVLHTDWKVQTKIRNTNLHSCWNILEDPFIERKMAEQFPGSGHNLDKVGEYFLEKITFPAWRAAPTEKDQLSILLVPIIRAHAGQAVFERWNVKNGVYELPFVKDFLDRFGKANLAKLPKVKTTAENLALARIFYDTLNPPPPPPPPADEDEEEAAPKPKPKLPPAPPSPPASPAPAPAGGEEEKDEGESEGEPAPKSPGAEKDPVPASPFAPDEDEESGPATGPDEEDEDGEEGTFGEEEREGSAGLDEDGEKGEGESGEDGSRGVGSSPPKIGSEDEEEEKEGEAGSTSTPLLPKDFMEALAEHLTEEATKAASKAPYLVYTRDHDVIESFVFEPKSWNDKFLIDLDAKTARLIGVMQKSIERMMASKSKVQRMPGYRSGALHPAALHRLATGDDRVFRRKEESAGKETIVSLLIDNSGSMGGPKQETAMTAAYALSLTLDRVGIRHEILGFTTKEAPHGKDGKALREEAERIGRAFSRTEKLWVPIYKGFNERLTPTVKKRIAYQAYKQEGLANNIDGECVEVAARRLLKEKAERRIMIVLSDGQPACSTYDGAALRQHLKTVVKGLPAVGIEPFGIGIMSEAVKSYYPNYAVIKDVAELPAAVMGKIRQVLSAA